jgi:hypothetical protein
VSTFPPLRPVRLRALVAAARRRDDRGRGRIGGERGRLTAPTASATMAA